MTILKEIFCIGDAGNFIKVKISLGIKSDGIKKVQALIKIKMDEIEQIPGWKLIPPKISNAIRHSIIRIAFAAYKIGLIG